MNTGTIWAFDLGKGFNPSPRWGDQLNQERRFIPLWLDDASNQNFPENN